MATTIKFRCPDCKTSDFVTDMNSRICKGLVPGTNNADGVVCNFSWDVTDDWKYFHVEITFSTPGAYQFALKAKQTTNVLGVLAKQFAT